MFMVTDKGKVKESEGDQTGAKDAFIKNPRAAALQLQLQLSTATVSVGPAASLVTMLHAVELNL